MAAARRSLTDPAEFLAARGAVPRPPTRCVSTVVSTVTAPRPGAARGRAPRPDARGWWVVRAAAGRRVDGRGHADRAVRAAPAVRAADARGRGAWPSPGRCTRAARRSGGANGALPAARVVAEETARLAGATVARSPSTSGSSSSASWSSRAPVPGPAAPRPAVDDVELCLAWFARVRRRRRRAGRRAPGAATAGERHGRGRCVRADRGRRIWLWEDATASRAPDRLQPAGFGVARVGPVYTPRGAARATASPAPRSPRLSAGSSTHGARGCLFTDQANPTSERDLPGARLPAGGRHGQPARDAAG